MKKNTGYRIDYTTSTVTVTKKFMEAAGIIGTIEFEQRKVLADMAVREPAQFKALVEQVTKA